jgi:PAS domain S-box-containing protein
VSGVVPIRHPETKETTAVLGIDIDATQWQKTIFTYRMLGYALTASLLFLVLLFYLYIRGEQRANQAILEEMSQRQRAEQEAAALGKILEDSLNEIFIFDARTFRFLTVNHGARENLGYTMEELAGLTPFDLVPDLDEDRMRKRLESTGEGQRLSFRTRYQRKDGSSYPTEVFLQAATYQDTPVFIVSTLDITQREKAEKALKKSEENLLTILMNVQTGILIVDQENYRIVSANPAALSILDRAEGDVVGEKYRNFISRPCGVILKQAFTVAGGPEPNTCC